jgi:hypothetical protein
MGTNSVFHLEPRQPGFLGFLRPWQGNCIL